MIVLLILVITVTLFYFQSENRNHELIHKRLMQSHMEAGYYYQKSLETDASAIRSIISVLLRDEKLAELFATYDRKQIFEYSQPIYKELNQTYNITHFYFTRPNRVNILRMHTPERYGDVINRITTVRAEKNQTVSYGVELGVLGTITLRVVSPWHDSKTGKLIGYIEIGMEIDHVIEGLKDVFNMDVVVVIFKEYLNKEKWLEGMSALQRSNDWNRFDQYVLSSISKKNLSRVLEKHLMKEEHGHMDRVQSLNSGGRSFWILSLPVFDVQGREIAEIPMLADVTMEMNTAKQTALVVGIAVSLLGIILIFFFWRQVNRLGNRISQDEKALSELATIDSLTGIYNRRVFDELLHTELQRSKRFNHHLSLLLLDIDYFKKINDTYGHQIGDIALKIFVKRISGECRQVDYVCRYGGEEFAIILPETEQDLAIEFAHRLLVATSLLPFQINSELAIPVTVSIGVSSYPEHAKSEILLLAAADEALYSAKESGRNRAHSYQVS